MLSRVAGRQHLAEKKIRTLLQSSGEEVSPLRVSNGTGYERICAMMSLFW